MTSPQPPGPEKRERVIIVQGEFGRGEQSTLVRLLGHFGLSVNSMTRAEYDSFLARQHPVVFNLDPSELQKPKEEYRIDAITSRNDFIVREHFDDFHAVYCPDMFSQVKGRAFMGLFDTYSYGKGYRLTEPVSPSRPQLIMRRREEVNIPTAVNPTDYFYRPQQRQTLNYAFQAGSLVEAFASLAQSPKLKKSDAFLARMSLQLASQFHD